MNKVEAILRRIAYDGLNSLDISIRGSGLGHGKEEYYENIPSPWDEFYSCLSTIRSLVPKPSLEYFPKFLDAGCGIGVKCLIARELGFSVHGIDINKNYIGLAKSICLYGKFQVANILTYKDYSNFDVVYFYLPISNRVLEEKFERRLFREVKPGAMIVSPHWALFDEKIPKDFEIVETSYHLAYRRRHKKRYGSYATPRVWRKVK